MPDPDDLTSGDGDGQQQQPPTLTEQRDDLEKRTDFYLRFLTGTDDVDDVRGTLEKAASEGRGDAKRLLEEHDSLGEMFQEEQDRRAEERREQEFTSRLDRAKAEIRSEREELAQKNADASLRAEALRALETEDGGDDSVVAVKTEVERLRGQYDVLDPHSKKADDILEEMTKLLDTIPAGRVGGKLDVDVDAFEREMGEVFQ